MVCRQTKSCTVKPTDRSPVFVLFDLTSYLPVGTFVGVPSMVGMAVEKRPSSL